MSVPLIHTYGAYLLERFGFPVRKVSVDAGFSCPNRDGVRSRAGCSFCAHRAFTPPSARPELSVREQIEEGTARISKRHPNSRFLAYFQPFSNTHAPVERLRALYNEALQIEGVAGIAVGTRPDCMDADKAALFEELAVDHYVQLELGLQSANDETLRRINRGHTAGDFAWTMRLCAGRGFDLCAHVIFGLPGETRVQMLHTIDFAVQCGITGLKLHNLHVVKETPLADAYAEGKFEILSLDGYAEYAADALERLPWRVSVQRMVSTVPEEWLVAPAWCGEPQRARQRIESILRARGARQGSGAASA